MGANKYRHYGNFEGKEISKDENGRVSETWSVIEDGLNVPCEISDLSGNEAVRAKQVQADVTTRISCRWFPGVNERQRLNHDGTLYNFISCINSDGRNLEWVIMAKRIK